MITASTIEQIINDLKKNKDLVEPQKADMLYFLQCLYPNETGQFEDIIDELMDKWD